MFALVKTAMVGRRAVLLVDEANGCTIEMLELLRSLNDNGGHPGGPGICLLGNEELHKTIRSGAGSARHSFARLNSRISRTHLQDMEFDEDIEASLETWGIADRKKRVQLLRGGGTGGRGR